MQNTVEMFARKPLPRPAPKPPRRTRRSLLARLPTLERFWASACRMSAS
ncbi:hypothetical protein V1279_000311 [Bradyrhizobium sp. AZCC 1610]